MEFQSKPSIRLLEVSIGDIPLNSKYFVVALHFSYGLALVTCSWKVGEETAK